MSSANFDIEETLAQLSVPNKIKLLAGKGWWHTEDVPENGIPSIRMSDGPNGVRGTKFFNGVPSSCFPCSTGLGSSFDVDLAYKIGQALGDEARAKGCHVLLAPTVNTQRSPLGGRGFESFSEDPHVNGMIASAYINGLQAKGVAATIKHYVANDQEFQRFSISSEVSERALREIYLRPFHLAIKHANPWALMTAYNRVNGLHCSEDKRLLEDILRKDWGWKGMIMSDWTGVYSTEESIKAGLDLEMPGPAIMRGPAVQRALIGEKLFEEDLNDRVRKILELLKRAYASGIPFDAPEKGIDTPELRALLRTAAADATVLLKNSAKLLPLSSNSLKGKRVAVIGPNAKQAMISGGGSASLLATYTVSPLQGLTAAAEAAGATVEYAMGAMTQRYLPLADAYISLGQGKKGALLEFWNKPPTKDFLDLKAPLDKTLPKAVWSTETQTTNCQLIDGVDATKVNDLCWLRYTTTFTPDESGVWEFGMHVVGNGNLFFDSKMIIDLSTNPQPSEAFFGMGTVDVRVQVQGLQAGKAYPLEVRLSNASFISRGSPFGCRGCIRLGASKHVEEQEGIADAVKVAKQSDVVVLVVGLNHDFESEGFDRKDIELPGATNQLIAEVLAVSSNTVIVNQSGTPVAMPWIEKASTVIQAFYGGNELGNGLADVLFGKVNPSGKLALTFPKMLQDNPSFPSFGDKPQEHGKIYYNEGVFVGYRSYDIRNIEPLFPFGHGLSYTTFEYSKLNISSIAPDGKFSVSFTIKNTGNVGGREAALVYISDPESTLPRAAKELKGFAKVTLNAGESKQIKVDLDRDALSFYNERKASWVAEAGEFEVSVGASGENTQLTAKTKLEKSFTWNGL